MTTVPGFRAATIERFGLGAPAAPCSPYGASNGLTCDPDAATLSPQDARAMLRLLVGAAMILLSIATWFLGSIWTNQQAMSTTVVRIDTTLNERVIRQVDSNTAINTKQTDDIDDLKNRVSRLEATVKVP